MAKTKRINLSMDCSIANAKLMLVLYELLENIDSHRFWTVATADSVAWLIDEIAESARLSPVIREGVASLGDRERELIEGLPRWNDE